jgi:hypothetical protein
MANTARKLLPGSSIGLAPLAFYFPAQKSPRQFPKHLVRSWLVATLIEAALAGVSSITLADDVIAELTHSSVAGMEPALLSLVECSGLEVARLDGELPNGIHAIVIQSVGSSKILAANLSSRPQLLTFPGGKLELPAFGVGWMSKSV